MTGFWLDFPWEGQGGVAGELGRMRRTLDFLANGPSLANEAAGAAGVFPLTNVTEDADNFYVYAELPGMDPSEINISITGKTLSLSGERKIAPEEGASYHRKERKGGKFNRTITLKTNVDAAKVEANFVHGVLTVVLPKAEEAKPRQIAVKG
ncbi:Hsp20/alpha crystallin family protein [Desulfatibacillum aliphaticivorans]|uniref:Heat shock protein Hsp20 n=1 Tax=Desulfatibacillum aliphaticivorans TaxID=218208 RepID=B8FLL7_DESAL|nr:Hsp20/alpha crystallin family protein [Desulfatibacillum aliphaticivorans]ACL05371.1 heat shock protein Hsp20 [Desulfatibacillum aliphaticivorans]